jgi:hypothetical protein
VDPVTLDSRDGTVVETVVDGASEALVFGGAPGLLVVVDRGAEEAGAVPVVSGGIKEPEAGGASGGKENPVETDGGRNAVLD